jgi:hypothetical protein
VGRQRQCARQGRQLGRAQRPGLPATRTDTDTGGDTIRYAIARALGRANADSDTGADPFAEPQRDPYPDAVADADIDAYFRTIARAVIQRYGPALHALAGADDRTLTRAEFAYFFRTLGIPPTD